MHVTRFGLLLLLLLLSLSTWRGKKRILTARQKQQAFFRILLFLALFAAVQEGMDTLWAVQNKRSSAFARVAQSVLLQAVGAAFLLFPRVLTHLREKGDE